MSAPIPSFYFLLLFFYLHPLFSLSPYLFFLLAPCLSTSVSSSMSVSMSLCLWSACVSLTLNIVWLYLYLIVQWNARQWWVMWALKLIYCVRDNHVLLVIRGSLMSHITVRLMTRRKKKHKIHRLTFYIGKKK